MGFFWCNEEEVKSLANWLRGILFTSNMQNRTHVRFVHPDTERFLYTLEKYGRMKLVRAIEALEKFGREIRMPLSRYLGNGLFELRVHGRQEIRLFYAFVGSDALVLHAFVKKSMKIPARELQTAVSRKDALELI